MSALGVFFPSQLLLCTVSGRFSYPTVGTSADQLPAAAKVKLRLGVNLRNQVAFAKLRFRTQTLSPLLDSGGGGLSCGGKVSVLSVLIGYDLKYANISSLISA
jgi:hypothetical protein